MFHKPCHAIAAALLASTSLAMLSGVAVAQSGVIVLDTIEVTAEAGAKREIAVKDVPQSVSVLTREALDKYPGAKVDETLRTTAGVVSQPYGSDSDTEWFSIRGFQADQTGVFMDGMSLYQLGFGTVLIDPFFMERLEVLKGPSSGLYGGANVGGIVNYVLKKPTGERLRYTETGINSFGNAYAGFDVGDATETGELAYRLTGKLSGGGWQTEGASDLRGNIMGAVTWTPDSNTELTVYGAYQNAALNHTASGFLPYEGTVIDSAGGFRIPRDFNYGEPDIDLYERQQAFVGYEVEHSLDDNWTLRQRARLVGLNVNEDAIYSNGTYASATSLNRYRWAHNSQAVIGTIDTQVDGHFDTGDIRHELLLGIDYKYYRLDPKTSYSGASPKEIFAAQPPAAYTPPVLSQQAITTMQQAGLYAQDQLRWNDWILTLNGRYDFARTQIEGSNPALRDEGVFSGRVGLGYEFDNGLTPYVSYTTSFLPQTAQTPLQELLPSETGRQWEAGIKYEPTFLDGLFTAAVFNIDRDNVAIPNPVPVGGFYGSDPVGQVNVKGAELEALFNVQNWSVRGALTYLDAEVVASSDLATIGKTPAQVPTLTASLGVEYHFDEELEGLSAGAGIRFVGESWADKENTATVPAATVFDASLRYQKEDWGVALTVSNIFDTAYVASCSSLSSCGYAPGRQISLSLNKSW